MKRKFSMAVGVVAALLLISTAGYSWNYATHAYIGGKIGALMPLLKMNQVYGIMAPDIFNLDFTLLTDNVLRGYTHGIPKEDPSGPNQDFMNVWFKASGPLQRAVAFGYVAHNDAWACDYVAHWKAIPPPPAFAQPYQDQPPGYIIALAVELDKVLEANGGWDQITGLVGAPLPISDRINFTHNIVEFAGDILIKRADPLIGKKVFEAALVRTPEFPGLLKSAIPGYAGMIDLAEETFRQQIKDYGLLLWIAPSEDFFIDVVSDQLATFAVQYLYARFGQDYGSYHANLALIAKGPCTPR
jgi:hypothetical protein